MADSKKVTKKDRFMELLDIEGLTPEQRTFIEHEIELLDTKNTAKKSNSKKQTENIGVKEDIKQALADLATPVTVSVLRKSSEKLIGYESQKISALLRQLIESGEVERIVDGKTALFALIPKSDEVED